MESPDRIKALQRLRAWAVAGVILSHFHSNFPKAIGPFDRGNFGVDLFFVISGYVVTKSFLRRLESPGETTLGALSRFYLQRIFRIFPLALLWLAIYLLGSYFWNADKVLLPFSEAWTVAVQILTLRFNYYLPAHLQSLVVELGFYWTLMVEEHVYIALPWLLILLRRDRWRILACCSGVLLALEVVEPLTQRIYPNEYGAYLVNYGTHVRYFELLMGAGIFLLMRQLGDVKIPSKAAVPAALLSWGCLMWIVFYAGQVNTHTCSIACGILVLVASLDFSGVAGAPWLGLNHLLHYVGARSYGLYLAHCPVLFALVILERHWGWAPSAPVLTLCFVGSLIPIVEILYRGVEQPLILLGRKITLKRNLSSVYPISEPTC